MCYLLHGGDFMSNITISIPDDLLKAGREYAQKQKTSLNALIRQTLEKTVIDPSNNAWLEESFECMDKIQANSKGKKWSREDLYDI